MLEQRQRFIDLVDAYRAKYELSKVDFAHRVGMPPKTLYPLLQTRMKREPDDDTYRKVARAMNIDVAILRAYLENELAPQITARKLIELTGDETLPSGYVLNVLYGEISEEITPEEWLTWVQINQQPQIRRKFIHSLIWLFLKEGNNILNDSKLNGGE